MGLIEGYGYVLRCSHHSHAAACWQGWILVAFFPLSCWLLGQHLAQHCAGSLFLPNQHAGHCLAVLWDPGLRLPECTVYAGQFKIVKTHVRLCQADVVLP